MIQSEDTKSKHPKRVWQVLYCTQNILLQLIPDLRWGFVSTEITQTAYNNVSARHRS